MKKRLIVILMLMHFIIYCTTLSDNDSENSECSNFWDMDEYCSSYCFRMLNPLLGYAKQSSATEDEINELKNHIQKLKININNLQSDNTIKDKTIAHLKNEKDVQDKLIAQQEMNILDLKNKITLGKSLNEIQMEQKYIAKIKGLELEVLKLKDESLKDDKKQLSCLPFGNSNGIHTINSFIKRSIEVRCDSKIAGNGWTIIQKRINGNVKFNRNWKEYKSGFGDLNGSFFIGLDNLHMMTESQPHELYIQLTNVNGTTKYARYNQFSVGNETEGYKIHSLGKYEGTAGDSLRDHVHMKFSTYDHNVDANNNCGAWLSGGWWYNSCGYCNLNGLYKENGLTEHFQGIIWTTFGNYNQSLTNVQMMIRPISK